LNQVDRQILGFNNVCMSPESEILVWIRKGSLLFTLYS
jgi:hypothetical protein